MAEQSQAAGTVSGAEAAKLLMVEQRWVRKLAQDGYIERAAPGRYVTVSVVQGYIRYLREDRRSDGRIVAENRVRDARARDFEVRTARLCEQLVDPQEAREVIDESIGLLRENMVGFSAKVTGDPEMRRKIDEAIEGIFARSAERTEQAFAALAKHGTAFELDVDPEA